MPVFDDMMADLHADEDMTIAAEFRRPPFTWAPVRVIRARESDALGGLGPRGGRAGRLQVDILASQVTDAPARGDQVRGDLGAGSRTYTVEDAAPDDLGLSYRCTLSEPNE